MPPESPADGHRRKLQSVDELVVALQAELRAMAGKQMARERVGHTLQPTALVHEAYLRLLKQDNLKHVSRTKFLAAAANTIRRILIEHALATGAKKRGGGRRRVTISDVEPVVNERPIDLLSLDEALVKLAQDSPRICQVVTCRYFSGMKMEEIAEALGVSVRKVQGDWAFAKAWLRVEMEH